MKSRKRQMSEGIELPNQEKIRTLEEIETYKTIKKAKMKEKIKKEYLRRTIKLLETKLFGKNLIKGINTWTVPLVRYLGPFLKKTREEQENSWRCIRPYIPEVI